MDVRLGVLGPLELVARGRSLKIGGPREHIVLAMLALNANRVISVDHLVGAVWGESPPSTARAQIQSCISALRRLFAGAGRADAIKTQPSGYLLSLPDEALDSATFTTLLAQARHQAAAEQLAEAAATLRSAQQLWRGNAVQGIASSAVQRGAALLENARLDAVEERVRLELNLGRHEEIIGELRALVAEQPLRERLYAFLMLALYRAGRQAEALETARFARATLVEELGVDPGPELRDLEHDILNRAPSLDLPAEQSPAAATPDTPDTVAGCPRQLPSSTADFIGRTDQIAAISQILRGDADSAGARFAVPIISIFGPGGIGKSTLALRVAHECADAYPDGHLYVDLGGAVCEDSTTAVLARFLRALGVGSSQISEHREERAELYRSRLANKRMLIVLDDAANEKQVIPLLPGSPSCAVIITSRMRLDTLQGAHWVGVDEFDPQTSLELLAKIVGAERVRAEQADADELVAYCGGLPLALRIAGARLASRPHWRIAELARRMRNEVQRLDEFSHHGLELRSSIGLSYRSLPTEAKRLFRLFAVVAAPDLPSWTAAALLDVDLVNAEATLERLVDVRLLDAVEGIAGHVRYRFHDLIRVYARERLLATETEPERAAALGRLLGAWLSLAQDVHRHEYGGDYTILHGDAPRYRVSGWEDEQFTKNPLDWLERERGTLVAVIRQAASAGMDEFCWDLALTLVCLFEVRGYYDDWRETTEVAYEASRRAGNRTGSAAMQYSLGTLNTAQGQLDEAERYLVSAQQLFEEAGHAHGLGLVLRNAAFLDRLRGNVEAMHSKYQRALDLMRDEGDLIAEASILHSLARFEIDEGNVDEAGRLLMAALALCQQANFVRGEAQVESRLAELYLSSGRSQLARQMLGRVLATVRDFGDRTGEAHALYWLGLVRRRDGRLDTAEATLTRALTLAEQVGDRMIIGQTRYALGELCIARGDEPAAADHLDRARTLFGELGSAVWLAKTVIAASELNAAEQYCPITIEDVDHAAELLARVASKGAEQLARQLDEVHAAFGDRNPVQPEPGLVL